MKLRLDSDIDQISVGLHEMIGLSSLSGVRDIDPHIVQHMEGFGHAAMHNLEGIDYVADHWTSDSIQ